MPTCVPTELFFKTPSFGSEDLKTVIFVDSLTYVPPPPAVTKGNIPLHSIGEEKVGKRRMSFLKEHENFQTALQYLKYEYGKS